MNSPLALVVLISGNGSNLQSIIDAIESGQLNAEIRAVVSNNAEAYGLQRAREHGIPGYIQDHHDFADRDRFDQQLQLYLQTINPDYIVLAGFMRILGPGLVSAFHNRIINIHPSLLPAYKGLDTHQRALENRETHHGVSIHLVTAELDGGPILLQGRYPIEQNDQVADLQRKGHELEHRMYPRLLCWLSENKITITKNQVLHGQVQLEKPLEFID